jgi:hypothetical protein
MIFLPLEGEQASHDTYGLLGVIGTDHWHRRRSLTLQIHLMASRIADSGMAIALFLGMWLSRVFVLGPLGFLIGFIFAVSQSIGESVPSPELLVRGLLWLFVAIVYGAAITVVLNSLFLPDAPNESPQPPKQKSLFASDAFCQSRARAVRAQSHLCRDDLLYPLFGNRLVRDPHRVDHLHVHRAGKHRGNSAQGSAHDSAAA